MKAERILVVEDEDDIVELIQFTLHREGFESEVVQNGSEALARAEAMSPDLILLDLMLPGKTGHEICAELRSHPRLAQTPVIMLTARSEEKEMIQGLEHGADDYVTKPFSPKLLCARIRAVIRRRRRDEGTAPPGPTGRIQRGPVEIDSNRHKATLHGKTLELTYTEFHLLALLAGRPGWVFSRYQIVDSIRGEGYPVTKRSVDVQVVGLRKKLGDSAHLIETVRGVGYRFAEEMLES